MKANMADELPPPRPCAACDAPATLETDSRLFLLYVACRHCGIRGPGCATAADAVQGWDDEWPVVRRLIELCRRPTSCVPWRLSNRVREEVTTAQFFASKASWGVVLLESQVFYFANT